MGRGEKCGRLKHLERDGMWGGRTGKERMELRLEVGSSNCVSMLLPRYTLQYCRKASMACRSASAVSCGKAGFSMLGSWLLKVL